MEKKKLFTILLVLLALGLVAACSDSVSEYADESGSSSSAEIESSSAQPVLSSETSKDIATRCKNSKEDLCEYGSLTDERDGQVYKTVKISEQWWMAENLNFRYPPKDGTLDSCSFCFNDSLEYCEKYGRLYLWSAAMDSAALFSDNGKGCGMDAGCTPVYPVRGVCPEGWHIPSKEEWRTLNVKTKPVYPTEYSSEDDYGGFMMRSVEWIDSTEWMHQHSEQDRFGFAILPAGVWDSYFSAYRANMTGFWSSTVESSSSTNADDGSTEWFELVWSLIVQDDYGLGDLDKNNAFSVRCIKD